MKEFSVRGDVALKEPPRIEEVKQTTLAKVQDFASDERFAAVSPALRDAAVTRATFFIDAPDQVVNARLKYLYEDREHASFNHREKEAFGSLDELSDKYGKLYDQLIETQKLPVAEASAEYKKQKKADVASRYARLDFAKILNYLPGLEGARGERDYGATVSNPEFKLAESLVREAVGKFS